MVNERLVLASRSPRRRELLARLVPDYVCDTPDVDEDGIVAGMDPAVAASRLALEKALAVAPRHPGALILGCDTLVVRDGVCLGKPRDTQEAIDMLLSLSDRAHDVMTGIALVAGSGAGAGALQGPLVAVETTRVFFAKLDYSRAAAYVARGESLDKAGAYGIQGFGSLLVRRIEGCYFNVVGLPLHRLGAMLEGLGMKLL